MFMSRGDVTHANFNSCYIRQPLTHFAVTTVGIVLREMFLGQHAKFG